MKILNSPQGLTKSDVGLGNADNTSDVNKPISTATQTALNGKKDYTAPVTVSFLDTFTRADATGYAAVGNGWSPYASGANANIVSNDLVRTDGGNYRLLLNPAAGVTLPADYTVTAVMATSGASNARFFYGLVGRWNGTEGVRAMFTSDGLNIEIGNAASYGSVNVYAGAPTLPAGWTNAGDHTLAMRMTGTLIELICDGTVVVAVNCSTNSVLTGTGFGMCGEGNNKIWRSIGASGTTGGSDPVSDGSVTMASMDATVGNLLAAIENGRLAATSLTYADANVLTDNGFYYWAGAAPLAALGTGSVNLLVFGEQVNWLSQIAVDQNTNDMWVRTKAGASNWLAWSKIALDSTVVHKTGNETITGIKSFSSPVIITSENWIPATLTNSWTNYGGTYEVASYRKMADGTVMLRGLIKTGTVGVAAFTLPVGYRPAGTSIWAALANAGMCRIDLNTTGTVIVTSYISPGTSLFVSLSGIRFSVNG